MKKLKYERPEVEVELLDPELDIITISGNPTDPVGPPDDPVFGGEPGLNF